MNNYLKHYFIEQAELSDSRTMQRTGRNFHEMIETNSTLDGVPHEITDGMEVFGSSVEDPAFSKNFIPKVTGKATNHSKAILSILH